MSRHDRPTDTMDPLVAAELAQLEAALAGEGAADAELVALVEAVRDTGGGPPPTLAFRQAMDARVKAGFPRAPGPLARLRALRPQMVGPRMASRPALGLAAALTVALVVVTAAGTGLLKDDPSEPSSLSSVEAVQDAGAGSAAQSSIEPALPTPIAPIAPAGPGAATPSFGRKVQQSTQLSLSTSAAKLQEVADGIVRVTQDAGGVVEQSTVDTTDRGGTAAFTLTVPSAKAQATVKRLSALAHVASMNQAATDITGSFVSVVDRLSDARAERRSLLAALRAAKTPEGIARLRGRIRVNRSEVASLTAELAGLRRRADRTVLSVTVTGTDGASAGPGTDHRGSWSAGDAARDAGRILEVALGALIVAMAVALPLGLLVLPVAVGTRVIRRRRREHALELA